MDNKGRFEKGQIPWNKGKKKCIPPNSGSFKKGLIPHNKLPVNSIVVRSEGRRWIKIAEPNNWIWYSNYLWEKTNGKVPKGMIIHHKDRDKLNDKIENFELKSRAEHMNIHRHELKEPLKLR